LQPVAKLKKIEKAIKKALVRGTKGSWYHPVSGRIKNALFKSL